MSMKRQRIFCAVAAIAVFLSAVCLESARADAIFLSVQNGRTHEYIASVEGALMGEELCTAEMLGVRFHSGICRLTSRFSAQRGGVNPALQFLCADICITGENSFFANFPAGRSSNLRREKFVITYIHESDGKKRIERSFPIVCL